MSLLYQQSFSQGRLCGYDQAPDGPCLQVTQTHSAIVLKSSDLHGEKPEADGLVTLAAETLAIKTADCLPILILGSQGVALLHAGWRGLKLGIIGHELIQAINPQEAFIAPCIHLCCFEVTGEFSQHFPHAPLIKSADGTLRFDLVAEARQQLSHYYPGMKTVDSGECTCCSIKYPSYRRDKTTKRMWNVWHPQRS